MRCIIVDDEPIARIGMKKLIKEIPQLEFISDFEDAESASEFLLNNQIDLVFLDIQMSGINGIEFAKSIPKHTLVIFTTAFSEYALDSYEVDAIDYLVKPIEIDRFTKAVDKASCYLSLLMEAEKEETPDIESDYIFVKSERKFFKVYYKDILFVEGLKDYVVIQTENKKIITKMYLKTIKDLLPQSLFFRVNRSYIINLQQVESFDNNDVFIRNYEIAIGNGYRDTFFSKFESKKL